MATSKSEDTTRDLRLLIRQEADEARKSALLANLERLDTEYQDMRETITRLRIAAASTLTPEAVRRIAEDAVRVIGERVQSQERLLRWLMGIVLAVATGAIVHALGFK